MPSVGLNIVLGTPDASITPNVFVPEWYFKISPLALVFIKVPAGELFIKFLAPSTYCLAFKNSGNSAPCFF